MSNRAQSDLTTVPSAASRNFRLFRVIGRREPSGPGTSPGSAASTMGAASAGSRDVPLLLLLCGPAGSAGSAPAPAGYAGSAPAPAGANVSLSLSLSLYLSLISPISPLSLSLSLSPSLSH